MKAKGSIEGDAEVSGKTGAAQQTTTDKVKGMHGAPAPADGATMGSLGTAAPEVSLSADYRVNREQFLFCLYYLFK